MKKLTHIDNFLNENNDLWNDQMKDIEKVALYCEELIGADLVQGRSASQLKHALGTFKNGVLGLIAILEELNGSGVLPAETEGSMPEPDEVIALLKDSKGNNIA